MIDLRIFSWQIVNIFSILLFPLTRRIIGGKKTSITINGIAKHLVSIFPFILISSLLQIGYFLDYIGTTEFSFSQVLVLILFLSSKYDEVLFQWNSEPLKVDTFSNKILEKLSKALRGNKPIHESGELFFVVSNPYKMKFDVNVVKRLEDQGSFIITTNPSTLFISKIIQFISLSIAIQSVNSNQEFVNAPIIGVNVSSILVSLLSITLVVWLIFVEKHWGEKLSVEFPVNYKRLLRKEALNKLSTGQRKIQTDIKSRAQSIIEKRDTNLIKAKKDKMHDRIDKIFGEKETKGIESKTIRRIRLTETVKRILNSTPPWAKVQLTEIAKLANGEEEEIELIIAGLRNLKEVQGIYDIWNKTYYGTSLSHWYITKLLNEINDENSSLENIKIFPDGGGEISFKKTNEEK